MTKKDRVLKKLDEFYGDEEIQVVYRDGSKSRLFFEGYEGNKLMVTNLIIGGESSFAGPSDVFPIPFERIGYVMFTEQNRKISFMPFSYTSARL